MSDILKRSLIMGTALAALLFASVPEVSAVGCTACSPVACPSEAMREEICWEECRSLGQSECLGYSEMCDEEPGQPGPYAIHCWESP